ncbi:transporter, LysE family [gamma proteobacterium IMCC1989]|nr:transporter, LysE family [gamma proteobacterium IMCC1989]
MLLTTWLTFLGLTIIATGSPGPGSILALSSGLYYGHKKALFTIAGSLFGLFLLFVITLVGLYALFNESPLFFKALASLGIFYLAYIGFKKWNQKTTSLYKHDNKQTKTLPSPFFLFKEGFLVAISNPKIILFFSVFFTPFIRTDKSWWQQITILAITFFICELVWQLTYALGGNKLNTLFSSPRHYVLFNKITGIFFIGSACFIAYSLVYSLL